MSIFTDIGAAVKKTGSGVAKGVAGVGKGAVKAAGSLINAHPKDAVKNARAAGKSAASAVQAVTGNTLVQGAVFPNITIPAHIIAGAVKNGKRGAADAVKQVAKNPVLKAEIVAAGIIFPPVAPASGAAIAASEAIARTTDALNSKDPKQIAQAAMQIGGTAIMASQGNPGAKSALDAIKKVQAASSLAKGYLGGAPKAVKAVADAKQKGTAKAKAGLSLVQHMATREALSMANSSNTKIAKKGAELVTKLQMEVPNLVQAVKVAMNSPKGVRVGQFAVLRTGRLLHDGKPIRTSRPATKHHSTPIVHH